MISMMIRTGLNSFELNTSNCVRVKVNFNEKDNYSVEDNVTSNLLMSYEERIKKSLDEFL